MKRSKWTDDLLYAISIVIQEQRKQREYSVYKLAYRSGVSQQAIGYYEKRIRRPNIECLAKLAAGMDMELSELIKLAENQIN